MQRSLSVPQLGKTVCNKRQRLDELSFSWNYAKHINPNFLYYMYSIFLVANISI